MIVLERVYEIVWHATVQVLIPPENRKHVLHLIVFCFLVESDWVVFMGWTLELDKEAAD
jgi:hypothetical protein